MTFNLKAAFKRNALVVIYWAAIVFIGFLSPSAGKKVALESILFLVLLLAIWNTHAFRSLFMQFSKPHKSLLLALIGLVLLGQVISSHRISHPFPEWAMYCGAEPRKTYNEYQAVYASGDTAHFPFHEVAPVISVRGFMGRFNNIARPIKNFEVLNAQDSAALDSLAHNLKVVMRLYNEEHNKNPIRSIHVSQRAVPVEGYVDRSSVVKIPILQVSGEL